MGSPFITTDDLKAVLLDLAARRRYRIMYDPHGWDDGSEVGHAEAREAVRPDDVATVAAVLWSHDASVAPVAHIGGQLQQGPAR